MALSTEKVKELADIAAGVRDIADTWTAPELLRNAVISTFEPHKAYEKYVEPVLTRHFDASVVDPTYARSNAELIREYMQSGQVLASARLQQYDFDDGVDDGVDVPISRHISAEPEEVYQSAQSTLERVRLRAEYRRLQSSKQKDRDEISSMLKEALSANPRASGSINPADKSGLSDSSAGESAD